MFKLTETQAPLASSLYTLGIQGPGSWTWSWTPQTTVSEINPETEKIVNCSLVCDNTFEISGEDKSSPEITLLRICRKNQCDFRRRFPAKISGAKY